VSAPPTLADPHARLGPGDRARLTLEVLGAYARTRRRLRRSDLPAALTEIRRGAAPAAGAPAARHALGIRLGGIAMRVLRPLPLDDRCLTQSVVVCALLARRGVRTEVVLGVAAEDRFGAHAWVELDGAPLTPPQAERFAELTRL
jgi:hypothetical protein